MEKEPLKKSAAGEGEPGQLSPSDLTVEDERKLQQLLTENKSIRSISKILGKTREAVRMKIARLGVVVDRGEKCTRSTTTTAKMSLPDELPSIEEELKVLVAALKGLETEGPGQI